MFLHSLIQQTVWEPGHEGLPRRGFLAFIRGGLCRVNGESRGGIEGKEFLEGFPEETVPELRLEHGLVKRVKKGVSAEGRVCSRSWRRDEPIPLQAAAYPCCSWDVRACGCVCRDETPLAGSTNWLGVGGWVAVVGLQPYLPTAPHSPRIECFPRRWGDSVCLPDPGHRSLTLWEGGDRLGLRG